MGKGEKTRQRIIEQTAPLFNQGGMAGCSMQDILHATGLTKGGIYRHFSSKEELAAECLKYSLALVFQARSGNAEHIPNAIDRASLPGGSICIYSFAVEGRLSPHECCRRFG